MNISLTVNEIDLILCALSELRSIDEEHLEEDNVKNLTKEQINMARDNIDIIKSLENKIESQVPDNK